MNGVVIDAGAALHLLAAPAPPEPAGELHAPRLIRSEVLSVLHAQVWRGVVPPEAARAMLERLEAATVRFFDDDNALHRRAWSIATALGWHKTYNAEYVALAQILDLPLLTVDGRLARAVKHLVRIASPTDIGA